MKNQIPKLYIGPVSKNVVDATIEFCTESMMTTGFCVSRRQIEHNGGYVNDWTTESFTKYVRSKVQNSVLIRDHGGPGQGLEDDDGIESFRHDAGSFDVIHIDPWRKFKSVEEEIVRTAGYIELCNNINPFCLYEVGTEQAIQKISSKELYNFLSGLNNSLGNSLFNKIMYVVIQSGTSLSENVNTGKYDVERLKRMVEICNNFSVLSKEHNGDYLSSDLIKEKFSFGLDAINIAPEFGVIETTCVLNRIGNNQDLLNDLHIMCVKSGKWKKWVDNGFDPFKDRKQLIKICCHYLFSNNKFKEMLKNKIFDGIDSEVKSKIKMRIARIIGW